MSTLFIGLGRMGAPMVRNYAPTHETLVFDAVPGVASTVAAETGATELESLDALPEGIDTVILMLPNSRIVESVLDGLLGRLPEGSLVIDMSSSEPTSTQALARRALSLGIGYVDAPVSGGVAKAATGQLGVMAGGSPEDIERALLHIEPMAAAIVKVGPAGSAHAAKALNNLVSATNIATASEAVATAAKFGIAPSVMIDVLNSSTGRSQSSEVKFPLHILNGKYDSAFAMDLMVKDLTIARTLMDELGIEAPVTAASFAVAQDALRLDTDHPLDHTELARLYEERNDVSFSTKGPSDD